MTQESIYARHRCGQGLLGWIEGASGQDGAQSGSVEPTMRLGISSLVSAALGDIPWTVGSGPGVHRGSGTTPSAGALADTGQVRCRWTPVVLASLPECQRLRQGHGPPGARPMQAGRPGHGAPFRRGWCGQSCKSSARLRDRLDTAQFSERLDALRRWWKCLVADH